MAHVIDRALPISDPRIRVWVQLITLGVVVPGDEMQHRTGRQRAAIEGHIREAVMRPRFQPHAHGCEFGRRFDLKLQQL